mgnify:CR=1 FL=1
MFISIFDMFKIGIGPSSSHTLGPMKAGKAFVDELKEKDLFDKVTRVQANVYGSLSLTGIGHSTDKAILLGLAGEEPETVDIDGISEFMKNVRSSEKLMLGGSHEVEFPKDGGFFFLGPSVNALTYAADQQLDVVNMSFYVDPWLYACEGGAPEDDPEQATTQDVTIELMRRAQDLAHEQGVTMVGSAGNSSADMADPGTDETSPNYGDEPHSRTIDPESCYDLPVEGPHVIGVSSIDEGGSLSSFSNWTTEPDGEDIEVAAPGGGAAVSPRGVLSATPRSLARVEGLVDDDGRLTQLGVDAGYVRDCPEGMAEDAPDPDQRCGLYTYAQGTSMASPHAAGVAALIISAEGDRMAPDAVRERLLGTAADQACPSGTGSGGPRCVGDAGRNGFVGEGVVDAAAAVS